MLEPKLEMTQKCLDKEISKNREDMSKLENDIREKSLKIQQYENDIHNLIKKYFMHSYFMLNLCLYF